MESRASTTQREGDAGKGSIIPCRGESEIAQEKVLQLSRGAHLVSIMGAEGAEGAMPSLVRAAGRSRSKCCGGGGSRPVGKAAKAPGAVDRTLSIESFTAA